MIKEKTVRFLLNNVVDIRGKKRIRIHMHTHHPPFFFYEEGDLLSLPKKKRLFRL